MGFTLICMKNEKNNGIESDFIEIKKLVYDPCDIQCCAIIKEIENADYGAYAFEVNGLSVKFRVAKITPTKKGQFVTLYKRIEDGSIAPYDVSDNIDLFVVSVKNNDLLGQFVFPKSALLEKDILTANGKGGKRALRVYPSWEKNLNQQAQKTQEWQLNYFMQINLDTMYCDQIKKLYLQ